MGDPPFGDLSPFGEPACPFFGPVDEGRKAGLGGLPGDLGAWGGAQMAGNPEEAEMSRNAQQEFQGGHAWAFAGSSAGRGSIPAGDTEGVGRRYRLDDQATASGAYET